MLLGPGQVACGACRSAAHSRWRIGRRYHVVGAALEAAAGQAGRPLRRAL